MHLLFERISSVPLEYGGNPLLRLMLFHFIYLLFAFICCACVVFYALSNIVSSKVVLKEIKCHSNTNGNTEIALNATKQCTS